MALTGLLQPTSTSNSQSKPSVVNQTSATPWLKTLKFPRGKSVSSAFKDHHGHNTYILRACLQLAAPSSEGYTSTQAKAVTATFVLHTLSSQVPGPH